MSGPPAPNPAPLEVYFLPGIDPGSYQPSTHPYQMIYQADVSGEGKGNVTSLPDFATPVIIPPGATYSFYITVANLWLGTNLWYNVGSQVGSIVASDDYLEIGEGYAVAYPFLGYSAQRRWNGKPYLNERMICAIHLFTFYSCFTSPICSPYLIHFLFNTITGNVHYTIGSTPPPPTEPPSPSPTTNSPTLKPTELFISNDFLEPTELPTQAPSQSPEDSVISTNPPTTEAPVSPPTSSNNDDNGGDNSTSSPPTLRPVTTSSPTTKRPTEPAVTSSQPTTDVTDGPTEKLDSFLPNKPTPFSSSSTKDGNNIYRRMCILMSAMLVGVVSYLSC